MTGEQLLDILRNCGLRGLEDDATLEDLRREFGLGPRPGFEDVIYLPAAPLFEENRQRWFVRDDVTCLVAPVRFLCDFDVEADGAGNHAIALNRLTQLLGEPEDRCQTGTLYHRWHIEPISISIWTDLRDKTPWFPLARVYEEYPHLWNICKIEIEYNWIRPLSAEERACILAVPDKELLRFNGNRGCRGTAPTLYERGILRRAEFAGTEEIVFWRDATGNRFGWYAHGLAAVFRGEARQEVVYCEDWPERAPKASASVSLYARNPFARVDRMERTLLLGSDNLEQLKTPARAIAELWRLEFREEYFQ